MTIDELGAIALCAQTRPDRVMTDAVHAIEVRERMPWEALALGLVAPPRVNEGGEVVDFPTIQPAPPVGLTAAARQVDGRPEWEAMHQWDDAGEESQDPGDWDGEVERNLREREEGARIAASFDVAAHNVEDSVDDDNANL